MSNVKRTPEMVSKNVSETYLAQIARCFQYFVFLCRAKLTASSIEYVESGERMEEVCDFLQEEFLLAMDLEFSNGGKFQVRDEGGRLASMEGGFGKWPGFLKSRYHYQPANPNLNGPYAVLLGISTRANRVYIFDLRTGFPECLRDLLDNVSVTKMVWDVRMDRKAMMNTLGYQFNQSVVDLQEVMLDDRINGGQRTSLNLSTEIYLDARLDKSLQGSGQAWNIPADQFSSTPKGVKMVEYLAKDCLAVFALAGAFCFHNINMDQNLLNLVEFCCFT